MTKAELKKHCEHIVGKTIQSHKIVEEHFTVLKLLKDYEEVLDFMVNLSFLLEGKPGVDLNLEALQNLLAKHGR